jgi:hypothetical protein
MARIYIVTNIDDNPYTIYVGKTSIKTRKSGHKLKFGPQIVFEYIDEVDSEDKKDWKPLESYWIEQFRQWGYNVLNKNQGGGGLKNHTEEVKLKFSLLRKGAKRPQSWIENMSKANKGFMPPKFNCQYCERELGGKGNLSIHEKCCKDNPNRVPREKTQEWIMKVSKPRPKENYKKTPQWIENHKKSMQIHYANKKLKNNF